MFKIDKLKLIHLLLIMSVAISFILKINSIFPSVFAVVYLFLVYYKFASGGIEYLFYSTILLSIMGSAIQVPMLGINKVNLWYIIMAVYIFTKIYINLSHSNIVKLLTSLNRYKIFLIAFILVLVLSFFYSSNISLVLEMYKRIFFMVSLSIIFVMEKMVGDKFRNVTKFMFILFIGTLFMGFIEIMGIRLGVESQLLNSSKFSQNWVFYKRIPTVFFFNQNNYAIFLVLGMIAAAVVFMFENKRQKKVALLLIYSASFISMIFTSSRVCLITVFVSMISLFIVGFIQKNINIKVKSINILILSCVLLMIASLLPIIRTYNAKVNNLPVLKYLNVGTYLLNINDNSNKGKGLNDEERLELEGEASGNLRFNILNAVVKGVIVEKHYFGFGAGNTKAYIAKALGKETLVDPHSMWFEILGDYGIFILAFFIFIYISIIFSLFKIIKVYPKSWIEKATITLLLQNIAFILLAFAPSSVTVFTPFFILLGISISVVINNDCSTKDLKV